MVSCVGFAKTPYFFISKHICHAFFPFLSLEASISMAFSKPLPRTALINGELRSFSLFLNISPRFSARSHNFSSITTWSASTATRQPRGFPPNVDPCLDKL
eukprot:NODE_50_length_31184_cov_0.705099.p31 type:complete len:101 gc:universal NODE_50_length_31184_cov_0.705099:27547-27245(-)